MIEKMTFDDAYEIIKGAYGDKKGKNWLNDMAMTLMKNYNKKHCNKKNNGKY